MAQTLAGTIDQMSLLEILKLLYSGKMNGCLKVKNSFGMGELFVKTGNIIHCVAGSAIGEAALSTMLGWIEGSFSFENDTEAPEESIRTNTEELLIESARKIEDWQSIKKIVPSMEAIFALSTDISTNAVNLKSEEWQVLAHINGSRTVGDIVEATGTDEFGVAKMIFHLTSIGLLNQIEKAQSASSAVVDSAFFQKIEKEFIDVIGPLAPVIIEEIIEELGETRDSYPVDKIANLIEKISTEIKDEDKQLRFSQIMLDSLKNL